MRIVVKIGTSCLTHGTGKFHIKVADDLAYVLTDLKNAGHDIALVTSGAIGVGVSKLGLKSKPESIRAKQAAAAVGQGELMYLYDKLFSGYNQIVAQILLTSDVMENKTRRTYAYNTLMKLFEFGTIPIINENDTVAVDEVKFGDNDRLSALVAKLIRADILILLTDTQGLFDKDPNRFENAKLIPNISKITDQMLSSAGPTSNGMGTGGMHTKLLAAKDATSAGIETIITYGKNPKQIYDILNGAEIGTRFLPNPHKA